MTERKFIFASFIFLSFLFLYSTYLGYSLQYQAEKLEWILRKFFETFRGVSNNLVLLSLFIFVNNAVKSLVAMLGGFFFGLLPILFVSSNGFILGTMIKLRIEDWGIFGILLAIVPHGIIEVPSVLLACSYGVWLGYRFALSLFRGERFLPYLRVALLVYVKVILPLLLVAALVEVFITPLLIRNI